jgi:iron transport multicopper oxidase
MHLASLALWATAAFAEVIGPQATITLANKDISPDGFKRSYVPFFLLSIIL